MNWKIIVICGLILAILLYSAMNGAVLMGILVAVMILVAIK